jgi:glycosyltransferase involved in cell wall biosynthesis
VFVDHTAVLSGAELCLLDTVPHFASSHVCLFAEGPLADELRARGVGVTVLDAADELARLRRSGGWLAALRAVPGVGRLVAGLARIVRPNDILYANSQKSWIVAALVARARGIPVIWHLHDIMSSAHFSRVLVSVGVLLANRSASAVVVNSAVTGDAFVAAGGRRELVRVVHNGIDAAPFAAVTDATRTALRRELGLADGALTIGVFGRITPWKGQHVLLDALRGLPGAQALVVGAPLFGEYEYLAELERRASAPELAGRVKFLGFRSDIPALMRVVDVVVHTSTAPEPFGRVIVEALLAQRPIVATNMGGVTEIVTDGSDGVLVAPADSVALAAAVRAIVADPARRAALAEAGLRTALQRFSLARMRSAVAAVVDDVIAPLVETTAALTPAVRRAPRVLLLSHSAEPSGAELSLIDIAAGLGESAVVCLFQDGPVVGMLQRRGVHVEVLKGPVSLLRVRRKSKLLAVFAALPAVIGMVRELRRHARAGDVLYANSQKAWAVAAVTAWWDGHVAVWHLRDILSSAHIGGWQLRAAVHLANHVAARVFANSVATGDSFVAEGGNRDLLRVVHNGIDEAPFLLLQESCVAAVRRELGIAGGVTVGLFGRLAPWKGQHVLLAAIRELTGVRALIVGDALFGEKNYRDELVALASSPELAGRVRFLGHRDDVPQLMKAVDIVVHTSVEPEPFGRVIVEGMLAERPVIATVGGGVREIIADGVNGLLVPPNDPAALAAAIRALAADPEEARRLAAKGRERARQSFLVAGMCRRIATELGELAAVG